MTHKIILTRAVTAIGTGGITSILFWMSLYLAGPEALLVGAIALAVGIAWFTRGVESLWALSERLLVACLIAAQASLLSAVILQVVPVVLERAI